MKSPLEKKDVTTKMTTVTERSTNPSHRSATKDRQTRQERGSVSTVHNRVQPDYGASVRDKCSLAKRPVMAKMTIVTEKSMKLSQDLAIQVQQGQQEKEVARKEHRVVQPVSGEAVTARSSPKKRPVTAKMMTVTALTMKA
tara:strand:+ start:1470 stop:1892 length:423 start_codon:yes stop_codon:yes gene_type:complete